MGYISRRNRRPPEYASMSGHISFMNEEAVKQFLGQCKLPPSVNEVAIPQSNIVTVPALKRNPIDLIIAVDGGFGEVTVRKEFPSSILTFYKFGALMFKVSDLENLQSRPFIDPSDIAKLKQIKRFPFVLPTRNISVKGHSLTDSVRLTFYEFFTDSQEGEKPFIDSLRWLIFEQYRSDTQSPEWNLASCPTCRGKNIKITPEMDNSFPCPYCSNTLYLTDIFRLHEVIDNELGAEGIISYTMSLLEQLLLVYLVKTIWDLKPDLLSNVLFIKDGPLAFFGQTANLHKPMRSLVSFLAKKSDSNNMINLVGIEKSGAFVDHANEIRELLKPGQAFILDNDYINKYIIPGQDYGKSTYYGNKVFFRTEDDKLYVLTLPTFQKKDKPTVEDFPGFYTILNNVSKLKCDMYDDALIPVAIVNKLVSLSQHPSITLIEHFAKEHLSSPSNN